MRFDFLNKTFIKVYNMSTRHTELAVKSNVSTLTLAQYAHGSNYPSGDSTDKGAKIEYDDSDKLIITSRKAGSNADDTMTMNNGTTTFSTNMSLGGGNLYVPSNLSAGTNGQVLTKSANGVEWTTVSGGGGGGGSGSGAEELNDLTDVSTTGVAAGNILVRNANNDGFIPASAFTGDLNGDIYASNTTSKILDSGTDGSDATFTGAVTGNASTATKLENSRTIAGQAFDGSQNITIAAADLSDVTSVGSGAIITTAERTKLEGIDTNANNYTLPTAAAGTLGGVKVGTNLSIDGDGVLSASNTTYSNATTSAAGLMSTAHFDKLEGIEASADVTDAANVLAAGAVMTTGNQTVAGNKTFSDDVTVSGDLTISGDTVTMNVATVSVEDLNITLGNGVTTDAGANGGGITLKGASNKTIVYTNGTTSWDFSEHINAASGKEFKIDDTSVLSATTLGSSVVNSSLTSVGTIATGTWNGTAIADDYIASAATWNGKQDALTFGIAQNNTVKVSADDVANGEYARFTATGLESVTATELKTALNINAGKWSDGDTSGEIYYNTGNVGIGTNSPDKKLHVHGDIKSSGTITATNVVAVSDGSLKTNIQPLENSLDVINKLKGVTYNWTDPNNDDDEIGLIAQEVEEVVPEVVRSLGHSNLKGVEYQKLTAILIEAVKELSTKLDDLNDRMEE